MIARIDNRCKAVQANLFPKHGGCNTVLKPVNTPVVVEYPHEVVRVQSDKVYYFIDWLRFFGKDLDLSKRHEDMLVNLLIEGSLFVSRDQSDRELMSYEKRPAYGQIHQGSRHTWSYCYVNSLGVKLWISKDEELELGKIIALKLEFTGSPLSHLIPRNNQLKLLEVIDLMLSLHSNIAVSRIDTTMEFAHELLDFNLVVENAKNWNFSGVKKRHIHISDGLRESQDAITVLLGSEKSKTKKVRIYDTEVKHGYQALRIEVENKTERAKYISSELLKVYEIYCMDAMKPEDINNKINDFIRDYNLSIKTFNFVDRNSKKAWMKAEDYKELPWWTEFKQKISHCNIEYRFKKEEKTVQKSIKWFIKNATSLMCAIADNFGKNGMDRLIKHILEIKRNGINCTAYNPSNNDYNLQLTDMGMSGLIQAFDDEVRWQLRQVGYFDLPNNIVRKDKRCFLRNDSLRLCPRPYQSAVEF